jgi:hypothetical protein
MVCDTQNSVGQGANMCYQCISPIDCPNGEGCNSRTHLCGSCNGPSVVNAASDCPPGDVCSNYWSPLYAAPTGVCLARCVAQSCPADRPICAIFPSLSQELPFCFGCLSDADCAGDPPGTWCDTSINLTFECQPPAGP